MKNTWLSLSLIALVVAGAGCQKQRGAAVAPPTKAQVMQQYDQAVIGQGKSALYTSSENGKQISVTIPDGWNGTGPIWQPVASSSDNIRVAIFPKDIAADEWTNQQTEDIHQVLKAEKEKDRYLLIVHHPNLKAILVKVFVPDPENAAGYVFAECRIADEHKDDTSLWNACKTALESLH